MTHSFSARYTLTRADALAWERLARPASGPQKMAFFVFLAASGATYALVEAQLPVWFVLLPRLLQFLILSGLVYGTWRLGLVIATHIRAARRIPRPLPCLFEDWGDHFYLREGASEEPIARETLGRITLTAHHLFIETPDFPVILPLSIFPDVETARAMAATWAQEARAAVDLPAAPH